MNVATVEAVSPPPLPVLTVECEEGHPRLEWNPYTGDYSGYNVDWWNETQGWQIYQYVEPEVQFQVIPELNCPGAGEWKFRVEVVFGEISVGYSNEVTHYADEP